jgi:hypothetical protein
MKLSKTAQAFAVMGGIGLALAALPALAQDDNTLPPGPKPAIKTDKDQPPALPVPGKTSFTSDQARSLMMKRGYNLTSNPLKDDKGIWYAEGQKDDGKTVMVMMDYQGNVFEGNEYSGHPSSAPGVEPVNDPPVKPVSPQQR